MIDNGLEEYWKDTAWLIATGSRIGRRELHAIYENLQISEMRPELLPGKETVLGSPQERKSHIFRIAEGLWGITPEDWLKKEKAWLEEARKISQSGAVNGKDNLNDVISAEILIRLIAAAKIAVEENDEGDVVAEAVTAINLILVEACAKGRTRMIRLEEDETGQSVYGKLRDMGLMIGSGGGKFLPYPEKSLPILMLMLQKKNVLPEAYIKE